MQAAVQNQEAIATIRGKLQRGEISYAEAAEQAAPIINRINARGKEIAKKHGMRPKLVGFAELMR